MPEERDELEQAWQALTERERLVQQTMGRRSAEIDARARRFDEIAADLDARRQLIEDAEEELVERAESDVERQRHRLSSWMRARASSECLQQSWKSGANGSRLRPPRSKGRS